MQISWVGRSTRWNDSCRLQIVSRSPLFVVDGIHIANIVGQNEPGIWNIFCQREYIWPCLGIMRIHLTFQGKDMSIFDLRYKYANIFDLPGKYINIFYLKYNYENIFDLPGKRYEYLLPKIQEYFLPTREVYKYIWSKVQLWKYI